MGDYGFVIRPSDSHSPARWRKGHYVHSSKSLNPASIQPCGRPIRPTNLRIDPLAWRQRRYACMGRSDNSGYQPSASAGPNQARKDSAHTTTRRRGAQSAAPVCWRSGCLQQRALQHRWVFWSGSVWAARPLLSAQRPQGCALVALMPDMSSPTQSIGLWADLLSASGLLSTCYVQCIAGFAGGGSGKYTAVQI